MEVELNLAYSQNSCQSIPIEEFNQVKYNALSVDHLVMTTEDIEVLKIREQCP
jgi:hypothetical protein